MILGNAYQGVGMSVAPSSARRAINLAHSERVSCRKTRQKFAFSSGRMEMGSCRPDTLPT